MNDDTYTNTEIDAYVFERNRSNAPLPPPYVPKHASHIRLVGFNVGEQLPVPRHRKCPRHDLYIVGTICDPYCVNPARYFEALSAICQPRPGARCLWGSESGRNLAGPCSNCANPTGDQ